MRITSKLADTLTNALMCGISANGGIRVDEDGNIVVTDKELRKVAKCARKTFYEILAPWEDLMGEEWEIEVGEE